MVLNPANQLSTTLRTSIVQEPFPHFYGVEIAPRFHGIEIVYGTRYSQFMALNASNQLDTTLRASMAQEPLWYSTQPTSSIQPSTLPWCKNHFHTFVVQELLHASMAQESFMVLNEANQLATTLYTSMPQEPFMVLGVANQFDPTFHTSTVQELLRTSMAKESFTVLVATNQLNTTLQASTVQDLLWYSLHPTNQVQPSTLMAQESFNGT